MSDGSIKNKKILHSHWPLYIPLVGVLWFKYPSPVLLKRQWKGKVSAIGMWGEWTWPYLGQILEVPGLGGRTEKDVRLRYCSSVMDENENSEMD